MQVGVCGFDRCGKTTLFQALCRGEEEVHSLKAGKGVRGSVIFPDPRMESLALLLKPHKITYSTLQILDTPSIEAGKALGSALISLVENDMLLLLLRAFANESVYHPFETVNPERDFRTLKEEFILSDLMRTEGRLEKIHKASQRGEKEMEKELPLMQKLKEVLEWGNFLFTLPLKEEDLKLLRNYQYITYKPILVVLNTDEEGLSENAYLDFQKALEEEGFPSIVLDAELEKEIAELSPDEQQEYLKAYGLRESLLHNLIQKIQQKLNLIFFYTVVQEELKSWAISDGTSVLKAAGRIHSDMERGFIKAEVISYEDFLTAGSLAEARKRGLLRLESKDYLVRDGDVVTIKFAV